MDVRIMCVNKTPRQNPHEAIRDVGGVHGGKRWTLPLAVAVAGVESGTYRFYVERPAGHRVWVVVARSASGNKYLKTTADGERPDNLLSLPECS